MRKAFRTSVVYAAMIIATLAVLNLVTSPGFLWFLYPAFGVLWWPLSAYFLGRKQPLAYAVCGTAITAGLLLSLYFTASPGAYPWYLFPLIGMLWWPVSVWGAKHGARAFSVIGDAYLIVTLLAINLLTSPSFWWWVYPAFFSLWWPVSVLLGKRAGTLRFAVYSAVAAFLFTVVMHRVHSPNAVPWYLFTLLPFFWWPVCRYLAGKVDSLRLSLLSVVVFAAYYTAINALLYLASYLLGALLLAGAAWLVYALGISKYRDSSGFAAINAVVLAAYFIILHRLFTPDTHPWYWYTFFPLAWWVYAVALGKRAFTLGSVAVSAAACLAYYAALNLWLSPAISWWLFLTGPAAVALIAALLRGRGMIITFSVLSTAALVGYVWLINLVFTPHVIWAVYPTFGLLWWPLSVWMVKRPKEDKAGEEPKALDK